MRAVPCKAVDRIGVPCKAVGAQGQAQSGRSVETRHSWQQTSSVRVYVQNRRLRKAGVVMV